MTAKKFDSFVLKMIDIILSKGGKINIHVAGTPTIHDGTIHYVSGEIQDANYWSTENIINISYLKRDAEGNMRSADYRFRPLSDKSFDSMFTITKIDGVNTLVKVSQLNRPKEETEEDEPVKESADEHIFRSMVRRLVPEVKKWKVYYKVTEGTPKLVAKIDMDPEFSSPGVIGIETYHHSGQVWVASIPPEIFDTFTIKSVPLKLLDGYSKGDAFVIVKRDLADKIVESKDLTDDLDVPIGVLMLRTAIANHFKKGGPMVVLHDPGLWDDERYQIMGYQWKPNGLTLTIIRGDGNQQEVIGYSPKVTQDMKIVTNADGQVEVSFPE